MKRHHAFHAYVGAKRQPDPCPNALTPEERAYILGCISAGYAPGVGSVRKLLHLCDQRLEIIRHLERKHAVSDRSVSEATDDPSRQVGEAPVRDAVSAIQG